MIRRHASFAPVAVLLAALVASCSSGGEDSPSAPVGGGPGGGGSTGGGNNGGGNNGGGNNGGGTGTTAATLGSLTLDGRGLATLDSNVDPLYSDVFGKYAPVESSSGRIHVLATSGVSDLKLLRARNVLAHGLAPVAGTAEGNTKTDVAAAMVASTAVLAIFQNEAEADLAIPANTAFFDAHTNSAAVLFADEITPEGTDEYMRASPAIDRTFGTAARLILETGLAAARPAYASELDTIAQSLSTAGVFTHSSGDASTTFLALAMDVHAGVFGHDPDGDGVARFDGATLAAATREDLALTDPAAFAWIESFFSPHHDFQVDLPDTFSGTFDCLLRTSNPYSSRAQHLRRISLSGNGGGELLGAPFDLVLTGNDGNNNLKGRRGYDVIDGGAGFDTAVYSFPYANYDVRFESGGVVIVEDVHGGHEQTDTLTNIERLQFSDQGFNL